MLTMYKQLKCRYVRVFKHDIDYPRIQIFDHVTP